MSVFTAIPHTNSVGADWPIVVESLQLLQQLAWLIAGASVGVLILTMAAAVFSSQRTPELGAQRRELWAELLSSLDDLSAEPVNPRVRAHASRTLTRASEIDDPLELISLLLSLQPQHRELGELVNDAGLVDRIVLRLEHGTIEEKIGMLELIGLTSNRAHLSTVLVNCTAAEPEVRRAALRLLSDLEPVSALDLHVRAVRTEGPWILEQLIDLVREPRTVAEYRSLHGDRRLADVIALLAAEITDGDERRALAAIEALRLIDHRATTNALVRGLRSSSPVLTEAARLALLLTPAGRSIVAQVSGETGGRADFAPPVRDADGHVAPLVSARAAEPLAD